MSLNMEITFFRILKSAKINDDLAQEAVQSLESHIAVKIQEATKALEFKMNVLIAMNAIAVTIGGYAAYIMANTN